MSRVQEWAEVHRLFHRENRSKAEIATQLGMSRTTVYRLLELKEPPRYERERRPSLLDPHKAKIAELLATDAEAPATVIIDHLRRQGYAGGVTILKDYLQKIRCEFLLAQGRQRTTYRPGEIGHGDWWEPPLVVPVGKNRTRQVFGFVSTLPHCAAHAVVFSFYKATPDFLEGLVGCLKRLGGVPDKFVVDNDSSIVEPRRPRAPAQLHDEVAALFGHLCCLPVVLDPGKPQSKGQVERMIAYFESSFLPLRTSPASMICKASSMPGPSTRRSFDITGASGTGWVMPQTSSAATCSASPIRCLRPTVTSRCGSLRTASSGWATSTTRCRLTSSDARWPCGRRRDSSWSISTARRSLDTPAATSLPT